MAFGPLLLRLQKIRIKIDCASSHKIRLVFKMFTFDLNIAFGCAHAELITRNALVKTGVGVLSGNNAQISHLVDFEASHQARLDYYIIFEPIDLGVRVGHAQENYCLAFE